MLEKVDFAKKLDKEEFKEKMPELERKIAGLQRRCRELKIPVMIVFEGFDAAGKGLQIGRLIRNLDPRGFEVFPIKEETEEEQMHPFLWRFWTKTPEKGRFAIFDGSWCRKVLIERFDGKVKGFEAAEAYGAIRAFEKQLTDDKIAKTKRDRVACGERGSGAKQEVRRLSVHRRGTVEKNRFGRCAVDSYRSDRRAFCGSKDLPDGGRSAGGSSQTGGKGNLTESGTPPVGDIPSDGRFTWIYPCTSRSVETTGAERI